MAMLTPQPAALSMRTSQSFHSLMSHRQTTISIFFFWLFITATLVLPSINDSFFVLSAPCDNSNARVNFGRTNALCLCPLYFCWSLVFVKVSARDLFRWWANGVEWMNVGGLFSLFRRLFRSKFEFSDRKPLPLSSLTDLKPLVSFIHDFSFVVLWFCSH